MLWLRELVTQDGILKKEVVRNRQDANTVRMIVNPYRMYRELAGGTAPFFILFFSQKYSLPESAFYISKSSLFLWFSLLIFQLAIRLFYN